MKRAAKLLSVAAVAVAISFFGSTALAGGVGGQRAGRFWGGHSTGFSSGYRGGYRGGSFGGFRGGYNGGYSLYYGGWGGGYPWNSSFGYGRLPRCYDYITYYYSAPVRPVYYSPPPAVYSSPPPVVYNLPSRAPEAAVSLPSVIRGTPSPTSEAQTVPASQYSPKNQSLGVADVKALAKAGLSDEVILNQISNSHVVYHLTAIEIIDLKESGVNEKVIYAMISTPPADSTANDVRFKLTGIMSAPEGGFGAVINGKAVVENSYVDGATVKRIGRDQVALDLDGHEVVVRLF